MKMKNLALSTLSLIFIISFCSCSARGKPFNSFIKPSSNKAIVYIYRPPALMAAGFSYNVFYKDKGQEFLLGDIVNGGFLYKIFPVGKRVFFAQTSDRFTLSINLHKNKIYCIRAILDEGLLGINPILKLVSEQECSEEIQGTNHILPQDGY